MNSSESHSAASPARDAKTSATQSGRNISRLSIATTKRFKDANDEWQEKTQWHSCVAYGPTADYAAKIPTGAHVFLEGELTYREYERTIETESGPIKVQWPVTEIVIESIHVLDRKDRSEKRGVA
jgi:single-strand DNA-binding protein